MTEQRPIADYDAGPIEPFGCICATTGICVDHCLACNRWGWDLEEGCIELDSCDHEWLDRPESDSRECLVCGDEVFGRG